MRFQFLFLNRNFLSIYLFENKNANFFFILTFFFLLYFS